MVDESGSTSKHFAQKDLDRRLLEQACRDNGGEVVCRTVGDAESCTCVYKNSPAP